MRQKGALSWVFLCALLCVAATAMGQDAGYDPLFVAGNASYEKGDYERAIVSYEAVLKKGYESGNLYYNIGNAYFKLGKIGHAIRAYEKARRIIPRDSDLKSNMEYAKSLVEGPAFEPTLKRRVATVMLYPFRSLNINTVCIIAGVSVALFMFLSVAGKYTRHRSPIVRKSIGIMLLTALYCSGAFAVRFHDEVILKSAIVIVKQVDGKYEPVDNSTTHYVMNEGAKVLVLKERGGWIKVRRSDGKISWIKDGAVGKI